MSPVSAPLLERQRIFASGDAEETRAFLRGKEFRFEVAPRDAAALDVHINGVYLPGIFIGYIQYGAPVSVRATPARDDYWIQLAAARRARNHHRPRQRGLRHAARRRLRPTPGEPAARGRRQRTFQHLADARRGNAPARRAARRHAAPGHRVRPGRRPDTRLRRSLARHLHFAVGELECEDSMLWEPSAMARFEELLVTGLSAVAPAQLQRHARRAWPTRWRRATCGAPSTTCIRASATR
jgi:hypothetical protein